MLFNKNNWVVVVMLMIFLADIDISFAASQCYEIKRKVCNLELARAGNSQEQKQSISDRYDCELSEQQFSEKMFKIHDEQRPNFSSSEIDNKINYYQQELSKSKSLGLTTHRDELELCFWQEKKNYYQQGNSKSNNSSSSGTPKQSKSNQQGTNSQSNQSKADELGKLSLNNAVDQFHIANRQKDYAKAFPLLEIIVAKSQDKQQKASAINRLGEYYKFGDGVLKDEVKAQALFEQASMMGETDADAQICHNYLNGIGVTENHQTAIKYCTTAANSGHLIPMAQLGWIYATGTGTQNEQLAKEWTCKAAQKGHAGSIKNAKILNFNCN